MWQKLRIVEISPYNMTRDFDDLMQNWMKEVKELHWSLTNWRHRQPLAVTYC